jgi:hypothetical protein
MKNGQKSILLSHKGHLLPQLDVMVLYVNFFGVLKNIEFCLKIQNG